MKLLFASLILLAGLVVVVRAVSNQRTNGKLKIGDALPAVAAEDQDGNLIQVAAVGKRGYTLVYFYPKAMTPGCTAQACSLRDAYVELQNKGVKIFGVSLDTVDSQKKFQEKERLPFALLSDRTEEDYLGVRRSRDSEQPRDTSSLLVQGRKIDLDGRARVNRQAGEGRPGGFSATTLAGLSAEQSATPLGPGLIMLTVSRLSKSFGGRILFEDAALQVNRGDRIALIGPNGAGKTTLFSILLGLDEADTGEVALQRGLKVGYLPQESAPVNDETVLEVATGLLRDPASEDQDLSPHEDSFSSDLQQVEAKAKRILRGLGFRETDYTRQAKTMSGGWIMRAHLGRLLVMEPDLLLLDEPTNHLDLESLVWLQSYLSAYSGAILLISHDRSFLNALADRMVEIDQRKLISYRGNYDEYLTQKAARQEQHLAAYKNQQREINRLQTFIDRFGAKNTKASQAQSKRKQIERMDKIEAPDSAGRRVAFQFPQPERSGRKVLELKGVDHAYGKNVVYQGLDYTVERNQRTVLVGPNGAGNRRY